MESRPRHRKRKSTYSPIPKETAKITFMKKVILRGIKEEPIVYLDDNLTRM